ncbi:MAG TPA: hypothetical protein VMF08_17005 [Candidatus Sulfotelmatobacter sp.]|nr:hypothetical protein [Candidatus Sulfotelmatobacter sp.]
MKIEQKKWSKILLNSAFFSGFLGITVEGLWREYSAQQSRLP